MNVAIDGGPLTSGDAIRGIGVHTRELIFYLKKIKNLDVDVVDLKKVDLSKYDVVHYPYFHPHFLTLPFNKRTKTVVTIHDLIRLIYPNAYPSGIKGSLRFLIQKINLRNVDAIITISETSKKDICRLLGVKPEKVKVIYLAPQTTKINITSKQLQEVRDKYRLPKKFILYVGDVNYNKNILTLANAAKIASVPLVIVGKQSTDENFDPTHPENKTWVQFLKKYKNDEAVRRLGFLSSDDLAALYTLASVYCQPSLYEGFGLQLLEAFQYKCPVIASKTQALVEIGDKACIYVDPLDVEGMATQIKKVTTDRNKYKKFINEGSNRLKSFSWERAALETYEVYKSL